VKMSSSLLLLLLFLLHNGLVLSVERDMNNADFPGSHNRQESRTTHSNSNGNQEIKGLLPRIVGGTVVSPPYLYPWMVNINAGGEHHCGGTLITSEWIMTAAHCVVNLTLSDVAIQLHIQDIDSSLVSQDAVQYTPTVSVVYSGYNPTTGGGDIGFWKLPQAVSYTPSVLDTYGTISVAGTLATVMGWGYLEEDSGEVSPQLMQVQLPITTTAECNEWGGIDDATQMCAADQDGGKDSCQGDSGGPLIVSYNDGWVQVGIVSFGDGCAEAGALPGVYSRVYGFLDVIDAVTSSTMTFTACNSNPCPKGYVCHDTEIEGQYYCGIEIPINNSANVAGIAVGATFGVLGFLAVLVAIIVLWRNGALCACRKKGSV
jgi:secreted trypsin-like serine protease